MYTGGATSIGTSNISGGLFGSAWTTSGSCAGIKTAHKMCQIVHVRVSRILSYICKYSLQIKIAYIVICTPLSIRWAIPTKSFCEHLSKSQLQNRQIRKERSQDKCEILETSSRIEVDI